MSHRRRLLRTLCAPLALLFLMAVPACNGASEPDAATGEEALSREAFIDVVVALRNAEIELDLALDDDSVIAARFEVLRDSILEAHGTSADALTAFVDRNQRLGYQDALWDTIAQRLKRPRDELFDRQPAIDRPDLGPGIRPDLGGDTPPARPTIPDEGGVSRDPGTRR